MEGGPDIVPTPTLHLYVRRNAEQDAHIDFMIYRPFSFFILHLSLYSI